MVEILLSSCLHGTTDVNTNYEKFPLHFPYVVHCRAQQSSGAWLASLLVLPGVLSWNANELGFHLHCFFSCKSTVKVSVLSAPFPSILISHGCLLYFSTQNFQQRGFKKLSILTGDFWVHDGTRTTAQHAQHTWHNSSGMCMCMLGKSNMLQKPLYVRQH